MVLKKILFSFYITMVMLLFGASFVLADASWATWGNYGYGPQGDRILFGSNWPQSDIYAERNVTEAVTISYPIQVQDLDLNGQNEVLIISGTQIILYDGTGQIITSISTGATNLGRPLIMNYQNDADQEIMICADNDLRIYEYDGESLSLAKTWTGGCAGKNIIQVAPFDTGLTWDGTSANEFLFWGQSGGECNISSIDFNTGVMHNFSTVSTSSTADDGFDSAGDNFLNAIVTGDIDKDGEIEAVVIYNGGDIASHVVAVSLESETTDWETTLFDYATTPSQLQIGYGNLGSSSSAYEIFAYSSSSNPAGYQLHILDSAGNEKYEKTQTYPTYPVSFWAVADIDYDGYNEACFTNETSLICIEPDYTQKFSLLKDILENSSYISIGEYDGGENYQELLTQSGIYSTDGSSITKEFNIGFEQSKSMVYPVSLAQYSTFQKDIAYFDEGNFEFFYTGITPAVCGNEVCESGENSLNCFQDCGEIDQDVEYVRITYLNINPNPNYLWLNGTRVKAQAKVETTSGSTVQARMRLYAGDSYQWDSGYKNVSPSGTIFTFDTFANYTGYGTLIITGRDALVTAYSDTYQINFIVDADEGISFDDYQLTITDPFDSNITQQVTSTSDNAVTSFVDTFFGLTGLSYLVIWLLIMLVVAITVMVGGIKAGWPFAMTGGIIALVEFILFIMGTLLGFIPIAVIIIFVIFGIGGVSIYARKIFTGG